MAPTGSFFSFLSVGICFFVEAISEVWGGFIPPGIFFLHSPKNRMLRFLVLFAETLSAFLGILMLGKVFHEAIPASGFSQGHFTALKKFPCWRHFGYTWTPFPRFKKNMTLEVSWIFSDFFMHVDWFRCNVAKLIFPWHFHFFPLQIQGLPFSSFFTFGWCYKSLTQIVLNTTAVSRRFSTGVEPVVGVEPLLLLLLVLLLLLLAAPFKAMTTIEFCEKSTQNQS